MTDPPRRTARGGPLPGLFAPLARPSADHRPLLADAPQRWLRLLPYVLALAAVSSLLPSGISVLTQDYGLNAGLAAALVTAQTVPLLLAVSRPLPAWWVVAGAGLATAVLLLASGRETSASWPWPAPGLVGYLLLMVPLALREPRRTLVAVWLATAAGGAVLSPAAPDGRFGGNDAVLAAVLTGAVLLLGGALREGAETRRLLAEQEHISEAERERRTLLEERARIARELHDVVAHHMSVIAVQAASAPYRIPDVPPGAAEEFTAIAGTARESLTEMRRLLGVLRSEGSTGEKAPQPGVDRLDQLVEAVGRAGVPAELSVDGELAGLPPAVALSAYRIVQEALANVVRHAPGARTRVSLTRDGAGLRITVVNAEPPERGGSLEAAGEGTGHGLVGMRERVRLLDGRLETGPLPDGGFEVAAVLPVTTVPESTA